MRNRRILTQKVIKQTGAEAIRDFKREISGSNNDVADLMGNCESTVRLRTDEDSEGNQITVAELLKTLEKGYPGIARALLALVGWTVQPLHPEAIEDVFDVIGDGHSFIGETIHAQRTGDGIDQEQAKALLPKSAELRNRLRAFENMLQEIADNARG